MKKMTSNKNCNKDCNKDCNAECPEVSLFLHDIRSIHNVGSIFRTADAFGVSKIYISGYTPVPVDRFGRKRADLAKVALGAENSVAWEKISINPVEFITKLKQGNKETGGTLIVALEQDPRSVDYREARDKIHQKILLILGNEVGGISRDILNLADSIAEIPMHGKKESLNVSVAAGIALFGMFS
jgi:tRNA G18 (ribose-2'-O)-methylase SpoU